jgi:hypothetical protein
VLPTASSGQHVRHQRKEFEQLLADVFARGERDADREFADRELAVRELLGMVTSCRPGSC